MNERGARRAVIVDDEPLARDYLRALLAGKPDWRVVGEAPDGAAAIAVLRATECEVVFLDIQMPGLDGFAVLEALGKAPLPLIVFVTAFDEYAVRAFDLHAVDYLLKPFDDARFDIMLGRVEHMLSARTALDERAELLKSLAERVIPGGMTYITRLPVRHLDKVLVLSVAEIDWIESADYCVTVHVGGRHYLLRDSLGALEAQLDPGTFVRSHRGALVNVERIREIQPGGAGEYELVLHDGTRVPLSRRRRDALARVLGRRL